MNMMFAILLLWTLLLSIADGDDHEIIKIPKGDRLTIPCSNDGGIYDQLGALFWKRNNSVLVEAEVKGGIFVTTSQVSSGYSVTNDSSLVVDTVLISDTGNLSCTISAQNETVLVYNIFELLVQDVPSPPGKATISIINLGSVMIKWPSSSDNHSPILNYIADISKCRTSEVVKNVVVLGNTSEVEVSFLETNTCYKVQVSAKNSLGQSSAGPLSDGFHLGPERPPVSLEGLQVEILSSSKIRINWTQLKQEAMSPAIDGYKVTYSLKNAYKKTIQVEDPMQSEMVLIGLLPYSLYSITVVAYNSLGDGPRADIVARTLEGLPSRPRITHITGRTASSFYVHWEPPKSLFGRLEAYVLLWAVRNTTKRRIISGHLTHPMSALVSNLRPYTEYKVQVAAVTGGGRGLYSEKYPALTDVAGPSAPFIYNVTIISTSSVLIEWNPPEVYYRRVDRYLLMWSAGGGSTYLDHFVSGSVNQYVLKGLAYNTQYNVKVAGSTYAIFSNMHLIGDFSSLFSFTLGVDGDNKASVMIWDSLGDDSDHSWNVTERNNRTPSGVVVGIVCCVALLVAFLAVLAGYKSIFCQKCYQAAYHYLAIPSSVQCGNLPTIVTVAEPSEDRSLYPDIAVTDFPAHTERMHADGDFAFAHEFEDIYVNSRSDYKCDASNLPENRCKNRYINIAAFDHSRVILKTDLGRHGYMSTDYINSNYVDGYKKPKAYIATQAPLPQTFSDFWSMVWEQNCSLIVMITNLMEKGRRKCDQYWPRDGLETYGNISVKFLNKIRRAHYTENIFSIRNMKVKKRHSMKAGNERMVHQFHYTEWPDHGVPDYTLPVLEFVRKSALHTRNDSGPVVVHCSAGVGRTGTYIVIDSTMRKIADVGTVNIPEFLTHIRGQRNFLVQTEDQYMFIHDVLVEHLMGGQTQLSDNSLVTQVPALVSSSNGLSLNTSQTLGLRNTLEAQYKIVTSYIASSDDTSAAVRLINQQKNRSLDFLPTDLKRVVLPAKPGIYGSDYINASYLQGYCKSDEFIVTQFPLNSTKEDFWRMVWDRNCPVIIVLKSADDQDFEDFWPEIGDCVEIDASNFKLSMRQESERHPDYFTKEFILESIQYDYVSMTKLVIVEQWPDCEPASRAVFLMIETALNWQVHNDTGPVIVMDMYGGVRAGRFCALWALRDQLIMDKVVDVYQLTKLYHYKRPGIIGSLDDFRFLYEALVCLKEQPHEDRSVCSSSPHRQASLRGCKSGTLSHSSTMQYNSAHSEISV